MRRRGHRVDGNQSAIVDALRAAGASVFSAAEVGHGFPDLVVGYRGRTYLLEVKDGRKPPADRRLTEDQVEFAAEWRGSLATVLNPTEALVAIGARPGPEIPRGPREQPVAGTRLQEEP